MSKTCSTCGGSGRLKFCPTCKGTGKVSSGLSPEQKKERERAIKIADGYVNDFHRKAMAAAIRRGR
jgi:DnaJ-class molecular chaperone